MNIPQSNKSPEQNPDGQATTQGPSIEKSKDLPTATAKQEPGDLQTRTDSSGTMTNKDAFEVFGAILSQSTRKLDWNWTFQLALILVGGVYLYKPEWGMQMRDNTIIRGIPEEMIVVLVPFLLFFLFIQFGFLLEQFVSARRRMDKAINDYVSPDDFELRKDLRDMVGKRSIFEGWHLIERKGNGPVQRTAAVMLVVLGILTLTASNAIVYIFILKYSAYYWLKTILFILAFGLMSLCYLLAFLSIENSFVAHRRITAVQGIAGVLVGLLYFLFLDGTGSQQHTPADAAIKSVLVETVDGEVISIDSRGILGRIDSEENIQIESSKN